MSPRLRQLGLELLEDRRLLSISPGTGLAGADNPLAGTIDGYQVSIDRHDAPSQPVDYSVPTWLAIHGNDSAPTTGYIADLADAIHSASGGDQVLTLDWSEIAALFIGTTENYIVDVAQWASSALTSYGFSGGLLNLVGHSFGAYVAAEMAERISGGVNTIVGLDPAENWPFGYNPEAPGEVDFAGHSAFSWVFSDAGGFFGSETTPGSADEAFAIENTDHSGVVGLFSNVLNGVGNPAVLEYFPVSRLLGYRPGPWVPDQYDHSGNPSGSGTYEAVITAEGGGTVALSMDFLPLATVASRHVFYNNSAFDGDAGASPNDDLAIAWDKGPLLPEQTATFANFTGYGRGISGIMVDIAALPGMPTADDFAFKVGNDHDPDNWAPLASAPTIDLRPVDVDGDGADDFDRVTLVWTDVAIQNQWMQVTVKATENTGLAEKDVFYFGNLAADANGDARVDSEDLALINVYWGEEGLPIDCSYDFNHDRFVDSEDLATLNINWGESLELIAVPGAGGAASIILTPWDEDAAPAAIRLETGESAAAVDKASAHDAVFEEAGTGESRSFETLIGRWTYLYGFEQLSTTRRPSTEDNPVEEGMAKLLASCWP